MARYASDQVQTRISIIVHTHAYGALSQLELVTDVALTHLLKMERYNELI